MYFIESNMSRPEHPGVPMPASCISRLREEQEYYDEDPERAEREQREEQQRVEDTEEWQEQAMDAMREIGLPEDEAERALEDYIEL